MGKRRGIGLLLAFLTMAILVSAAGVLVTYVLISREPAVPSDARLDLRLRGEVVEIEPIGVLGQFFQTPPTVRSIVDSLRKAKHDRRISAVVLRPSGAGAFWGKLQEIREAVEDFRTSGKPVIAHLEFGGAAEYYLASAADRIYMVPTSHLDLTGVATYEVFLRGTLDKIGTYPDLMRIGDYKTAASTFTETGYTSEHREMMESLTNDFYEQLLRGIAEGRRLAVDRVRALIDEGPFLPADAVEAGLVDALLYADEIEDTSELDGRHAAVTLDDYRRVSVPGGPRVRRGDRIALIYAVGMIVSGESRLDGPQSPLLGSDSMVEDIRRAREDESVKAIVVRVDSPGGSAVASDVIWREMMLARREKPVVVSMSDLAASGGYYIAMPAHTIVAQPGTLTGSIGIVMGKFVTSGTLEKLGMTVDGVSRGRQAGINSPVRPYAPDERARIEEQMQHFYDQFVEKAAAARGTSPDRIDALAQGRVWTGRQARDVGLVDELGGLRAALAAAKRHAGLPDDEDVELLVLPARRSFYEFVRSPFSGVQRQLLARWLHPAEQQAIDALAAPLRLFRHGEPLALMPSIVVR